MENNYKLGKFEAICLLLIITINKLILNVPYYIVDSVGTGALINLVYIGIIGFLYIIAFNKLLSNFPNHDIIDILKYIGGKPFQIILGILIIILFFFVSYLTLNNFATMLKTIYFNKSPLIFILLFFILGTIFANVIGFKSIVRTICFIIPFSIISILIALFGVYDEFSFNKFTPIFGYDYKTTFLYGMINIFSFYIFSYYYFLMPLLKNTADFKKITTLSFIISWILLFFTVISILAIFPVSINIEPLNSLYMLSRQIELGDFIQRLDAVFIMLWLFSIFCYLSLNIFMINRIIKKITNISNEKMLSYSTSSILFGLALLPIDIATTRFLENAVYKYLMVLMPFVFFFIILIIANIKKKLDTRI